LEKLKSRSTGTPESQLRASRDIYPLWIEELEKSIKHDLAPKSIALLTGLSAYSGDPQNDMFKGESSIGKTWNATNVVKYFPLEDVWMLGGLSPTALVHDYGKLEHAETGEPLDEDWVWQRVDEWDDGNPVDGFETKTAYKRAREREIRRLKKEWRETPKKYVVNLSHKILLFLDAPHIETFNRLRPILSHDAWEITYKFTDRGSQKSLATQTVTLRGWPATIFCTTDKTWMEDLATRSFTATPRTHRDKLRGAILLTASKKSRPWLYNEEDGRQFKEYIKSLKTELLDGWVPVVPFCEELANVTPPLFGRDMRDFKHVSTLIEMMALLHFYTRPKVIMSGQKYVLATTNDFLNVLKLWKDIEMTTQTGLTGEELFAFECLTELEKHGGYITLKDIVDAYNREQPKTISGKTAYKYLENLCVVGLTDKHKDERPKEEGGDARRNLYRSLGRLKNRISKAWECSLPFFHEEDLEKWFVDVLKHSPENEIRLICFSEKGQTNHTIRIGDGGGMEKNDIVKTLFSGEYFCEPTPPEKQTKLPEKPQEKTPAQNIVISTDLTPVAQDVHDLLSFHFMECGKPIFYDGMIKKGYHRKDLDSFLKPLIDRGLLIETKDTFKLGDGWEI